MDMYSFIGSTEKPEQGATFILHGQIEICTRRGRYSVADLRPGDQCITANGTTADVFACHAIASNVGIVSLPAVPGAPPLLVAAETLLLCDHFLCMALFGRRKVTIRLGDIMGPSPTQPPCGMYCLETHVGAEIELNGYRCIATPWGAPQQIGCLDPGQAAQISQSGILFRHLVTP